MVYCAIGLTQVEASEETAAAVAERPHVALAIRVAVRAVPPDSLPRWELKARRIVDRRNEGA